MNASLTIKQLDNGNYRLFGALDRDTVPSFWQSRMTWLPKESHVNLDLCSVRRIDSAGMAMLLHLHQQLLERKQSLSLYNVPSQLAMLLQLSNIDNFFVNDQAPAR